MVFLGLFFEVLILKKFVVGVSGSVSKVLKMLVFFPVLGAFLGWLIVVHLGLEGLGVFVFLVYVFLFFSWFCFCFVCFVIGFVVGCCCFVFLFFLFCFSGPPHLALNPPCFFCFVCLFFLFYFLFFWFFCFCFFGGFKGQVRWPKGPPYLALNPPFFVLFVFVLFVFFCYFVSLSLLLLEKNRFPPKKGFLCIFSVSLFSLF